MNKRLFLAIVAAASLLVIAVVVSAQGRSNLAEVKNATAQFHRTEIAQAAGWDLREGLDHCFDNQPIGGMGYHYINMDILDNIVDVLQPEAMVYTPGPNGQHKLGAVEYIVDQASWDAENPGVLPEVLGQQFHLHPVMPIYVLHAWIWQNNPAGVFEDWNPNVSCP